MATKKETNNSITIETPRKSIINIELIGETPLILRAKSRSYEREEIFKQSNPKGTKIPTEIDAKINYNLYEKLITSIHWRDKVEVFDDYSLYTKEMWEDLMKNNAPCILAKAFKDSFKEVFISFGYKESTSRNGTDLERTLTVMNQKTPITFESVKADEHLAQTDGVSRTNVLTQNNVFYGWKANLQVSHIDTIFPSETIISIVRNAGEYLGIGGRRKEGFGRYDLGQVSITNNI